MRVILTGPTGVMYEAPVSFGAITNALNFLINNFDRTNAVEYSNSIPRESCGREYFERFTVRYGDGRVNQYNLFVVR